MKDTSQPLLEEYQLGDLTLKNRVVMSSLTRARATNPELIPTRLMSEYYTQRASAGLILSEGTWVNMQSIGFINVPGIYTQEQVEEWKIVTNSIHESDGLIFPQLGHIGAGAHPDLQHGELPVGPSAINIQSQSFTPEGFKDTVTPREMTVPEIHRTVQDYRQAAQNAKDAGFDGIEIHAIAGMLIPQFLSKASNHRIDEYGGSIENRSRIVFEILDAVTEIWESQRVAIKFSPVMLSNVGIVKPDEETVALFKHILNKLDKYNLAFVHIVGPSEDLAGTDVEELQENYFAHFRNNYRGRIIANLGFSKESANEILKEGYADLVSFGESFIGNPDLVERFKYNLPLSPSDRNTYYSGEEHGYTTYPKSRYPTS